MSFFQLKLLMKTSALFINLRMMDMSWLLKQGLWRIGIILLPLAIAIVAYLSFVFKAPIIPISSETQDTTKASVISSEHKLTFKDHNRKPGKNYHYFIVSVDAFGNFSSPSTVKIKGSE